jgi:hypothetical protein
VKIEFYVLGLKRHTIFLVKIRSILQYVFNNTCNINRAFVKFLGGKFFFEVRKHMSKNIGRHILVIG